MKTTMGKPLIVCIILITIILPITIACSYYFMTHDKPYYGKHIPVDGESRPLGDPEEDAAELAELNAYFRRKGEYTLIENIWWGSIIGIIIMIPIFIILLLRRRGRKKKEIDLSNIPPPPPPEPARIIFKLKEPEPPNPSDKPVEY